MLLCQVNALITQRNNTYSFILRVQLAAVYCDVWLVYPISPRAPRREAWCGLQRDLQPAATPIFLRCVAAAAPPTDGEEK